MKACQNNKYDIPNLSHLLQRIRKYLLEKLVKSHQLTHFLADFSRLDSLCYAACGAARRLKERLTILSPLVLADFFFALVHDEARCAAPASFPASELHCFDRSLVVVFVYCVANLLY
jgi:ATP/maltotriose-dependent transcriptional regulator MalT